MREEGEKGVGEGGGGKKKREKKNESRRQEGGRGKIRGKRKVVGE